MNKRCGYHPLPRTFGMRLAVLLCALVAGCATIPAEQCAKVNWYALGVEDGRKGYTADRITKHREACASVNVIPDEGAYLAGRTEGLREYCTPQNAFVEGLAGREYRSVCPLEVSGVFTRNHRAAYSVYKARNDLQSVENDIDNKEKELRKKKKSDRERKELRNDIRELDDKRQDLRDELYRLETELDRLRENK
jgi:Protein of unknown function (DUF2799)